MDKYLIILIIIMILYYIQKYCIQSEVEQILITKNIIEKFIDSNTNLLFSNVVNKSQLTKRLDLSGSLIINKRHKLTSDSNYLKLTDVSGLNFLNMSVKNLDVSGELLVRQNSTFTRGLHRFNSLNIDTSSNNAGIKSVQGNLTINGSKKILGNTDISGNLRINNVKPILIKIFTTTDNIIDTGVPHSTYSGIGFSGYNHSTSSSTRTPLEFNTYKLNGKWYVSFTPTNTQQLSIRLIFFNTFFHSDESAIGLTVAQAAAQAAIQAARPEAPIITDNLIGDKSITLSWNVTNPGTAITSNTVKTFVHPSVLNPISTTTITPIKQAIIPNLINGTSYTFKVFVTNGAGNSPDSSVYGPLIPKTVPDKPILGQINIGDRSVTLNWAAPSDTGGSVITSYTVRTFQNSVRILPDVFSTTLFATVNNLTNGLPYTFSVVATNVVGDSLPSIPSNPVTPNKTPGIPRNVTATLGNRLANVSWDVPLPNGSTAITSYTVKTYQNGTTWIKDIPFATTPQTVSDLSNGTPYTFKVVAINIAGDSLESSASNSVIPNIKLNKPTIINNNVIVGNGLVTVNWTEPLFNGGTITSYTVTSYPDNKTSTTSNGITLVANVTGLTNNTAYTFKVVATNSAGPSDPSDASDPKTPNIIPNKPNNVRIRPGDREVTVEWNAPDNLAIISTYTVRCTSDINIGSFNVDGSTLSKIVPNLTNGRSYTFNVVATNSAGNSPESDTITGIPVTPEYLAPEISVVSGGSDTNFNVSVTFYTTNATIDADYLINNYKAYASSTSNIEITALSKNVAPFSNGVGILNIRGANQTYARNIEIIITDNQVPAKSKIAYKQVAAYVAPPTPPTPPTPTPGVSDFCRNNEWICNG